MIKLIEQLKQEERGSVMVAVIVVMVISFAIVATVATVYGGLNLARSDQNRVNAFQFANAGVDQALYRIDARNIPAVAVGGYTPVVSGTVVTGFTDTITQDGATFTVIAEQDPPGQEVSWKVRSTGIDASGRTRLAIATVSATPLFVNGFFTHRLFKLTGSQTSPVAYDSRVCPSAALVCELKPVPVRMGTNDVVEGAAETYADFVANWLGFNMYGRATQEAADIACGGSQLRCTTYPKVIAITDRFETPYPDEPSGAAGCPNGGNIGSTGITTVIPPGDYICNNLSLAGTIVIGSGGNGIARFWVRGNFGAANNAIINQLQQPRKLQIFQKESTTNSGSICGARVWALLYTPGLTINCTGSHQPEIWGAVVADFHGGTGAHFQFHYDLDTLTSVHNGKYVVKNWRECPPGVTDC